MPQTTKAAQLAQTIRSRLLGVLPMDQEIQLEDSDWRLILDALEPSIFETSCDAPSCGCVDGEDCRANAVPPPPPPPHPHLVNRLAVLSVQIEALAGRLPHPDSHTVRVVSPIEIHRDCDRDTETWYLDPAFQGHAAPFSMGDAVTDSSAYHGLFQVLSVGRRYRDKKVELRLKRHPGFVFDTEEF